ncbi:hypothetical protein [Geodermatophilus amargosae]|uniref:hypothetical protein n=1 Tax=Geodermatophilus amargosae TaxID=1296565 RepID=UPI001114714F|nr:hypothetical protein [Geodermatophilus amargosae]
MTASSNSPEGSEVPKPVITGLWVTLGILLIALVVIAATLLVRMQFFSNAAPTNQQINSIWAFLGVALGAVVTLIGALLTDQHNRRTTALAREAAHRQQLDKEHEHNLATQAEKRLALDTVAKLLELLTDDSGQYAPKARVGGAIATMMELHGGSVAIRILGDLWATDKVEVATAVWLLEQVLEDEDLSASQASDVTTLLALNATKLFPTEGDEHQDWNAWPKILHGPWPPHLTKQAKHNLLMAAVYALMGRNLQYWKEKANVLPVQTLYVALEDSHTAWSASQILITLSNVGVLQDLPAVGMSAFDRSRVRSRAAEGAPALWWSRLLHQLEQWAQGQQHRTAVRSDDIAAITNHLGGRP